MPQPLMFTDTTFHNVAIDIQHLWILFSSSSSYFMFFKCEGWKMYKNYEKIPKRVKSAVKLFQYQKNYFFSSIPIFTSQPENQPPRKILKQKTFFFILNEAMRWGRVQRQSAIYSTILQKSFKSDLKIVVENMTVNFWWNSSFIFLKICQTGKLNRIIFS